MFRFLIKLTLSIFTTALLVIAVNAQAASNWSLNINADKPSPVAAGTDMSFSTRINNTDNFPAPATSIKFVLPKTAIFNGINDLEGCAPLPEVGVVLAQDFEVTCTVPPLQPGDSIIADVKLQPTEAGTLSFYGKVEGIGGNGPDVTRGITVVKGADLELGITLAETTVKGGGTAEFTAVVTNKGPYPSENAILTFPVPTGLKITTPLPDGCVMSSAAISCTIAGPIAVGEKVELPFSGQVTTGNASDIAIAAQLDANEPLDPNVNNNQVTANIKVLAGTDVSLSKTRSPQGLLLIGDAVDFTLAAQFAGDEPSQAIITDTLPEHYDYKDIIVPAGSGWACNVVGRTITCTYTKAAGSNYKTPITIKTVAALASPEGKPVVNEATIESVNEDADRKDNNTATDGGAHIVPPTIDLKANKSRPRSGLVVVGVDHDYSLSTTNLGNANFSGPLTITDHLPEGLTMKAITAPADWICSPASAEGPVDIVCTTNQYTETNPLRPGATTPNIVLTAEATEALSFKNGMTVSYPGYNDKTNPGHDVDIDNNTVYVGGTAGEGPTLSDLEIKKTIISPSATVVAGEEIEFALEIINKGQSVATDIVINDRLQDIVAGAAGMPPQSILPVLRAGAATGFTCSAPASGAYSIDMSCDIASLPVCTPGDNCPVVTVKIRPGSEGKKTNTAHVFSTKVPDPDLSNNVSSVNYEVTPKTDVALTKTSPSATLGARAGQELIYTITASVPANGLSAADDVTVTDILPEGVYFVSATASVSSCSVRPPVNQRITSANNKLECSLGRIENGSQQTVTVIVKPTTDMVGDTITNNASVKTSTPETNADNNAAKVPVLILEPVLDLIISKTDDPYDPVEKGAPTFYTITATNRGPSDAYNVVITDTLPVSGFHTPIVLEQPAGLVCTSSGTIASTPGGSIVCKTSVLEANTSLTYKIQMTSAERGRHRNNILIESDETAKGYERPTANNVDSEDTTVRVRSDVSVTKTPSETTVDLREKFTWSIVVSSLVGEGLEVAENVTLDDTLPVGMELTALPVIIGSSTARCTGAIGGRVITCELGDMEPGTSITVELETKITDKTAQSAENTATVKTDSFDQNPGNNSDTGKVTTVLGSLVSGKIYRDFNSNDVADTNDSGIAGITVTLTGTALHDGAPITKTGTTKSDGTYDFSDVPPGTYSVSYSNVPQAASYEDGKALPGTSNAAIAGAVGVNTINNIVITNAFNGERHDFTRVPVPSVTLEKTAKPNTPVSRGDGRYSVSYVLKITNTSQEPLKNIELHDVLGNQFGTHTSSATPAEGEYYISGIIPENATVIPAFNGSDSTLLVQGAVLGSTGAIATVTVDMIINPTKPWAADFISLVNNANVSALGEYSNRTSEDTATATVVVKPNPSVSLEKTHNYTPGAAGGIAGNLVEYTFKITNTGDTPLSNVAVTDPMPDLTWVSNQTIGDLAIGQTVDLKATYTLKQSDIDNEVLRNTASVSGKWGTGDTQTVTDTDSAEIVALGKPGLTLVKLLDTSEVQNPTVVGDIVTYTFTLTNTGNTTLRNLVVTDALAGIEQTPEGAFSIASLPPATPNNSDHVVTVKAAYKIQQKDIDAGQVINIATATGEYGSSTTPKTITTDPSSVTEPTYRDAKLSIVKALTSTVPDAARAGDELTWSVVVTNTGNVTLNNITITDPLIGATIAPVELATLAPAASFTFTVTAPIQQDQINAGEVVNTATADFEDPTGPKEPVVSNEVVTPLAQTPAIKLRKTADISAIATPPAVGNEVVYALTIRNTGNVPLNGIVLTDDLEGFVLDAADVAKLAGLTLQPQNANNTVAENLVQITVYGRYKLTAQDVDAGKLTNTALVTGIPTDGDKTPVTDTSGTEFDNETPTIVDLNRAPAIKLIKTITSPEQNLPLKAGDQINYAFSVQNTGNVTLTDIRIEELDGVSVLNPTNWSGPLAADAINEDAFTAVYTLTQKDIDAGHFINNAIVHGKSGEDDVEDSSEARIDFVTEPAISIVKSASADLSSPSKPGDIITYSFLITNTGNVTLSDVVLNDPLDGLVLTVKTIATLLPGESNAVTLTGTYAITQADIEAGKVINQATVEGDFTNPQTGEKTPLDPVPSEEIEVPLERVPGLALVKEATSNLTEPAEADQTIDYTFTVTNTGNLILTGVTITDPLPGITPNSFDVGDLEPGESQIFNATYAITEDDIDAEQVVNQATAKGTYGGPTDPKEIEDLSGPTIDTDEPVIVPVVPPAPEVSIIKAGVWNDANGNGYPEVGETLDYTITITNEGNAQLNNLTPVDQGPEFGGRPATNKLSAITPEPVTLMPGQSQIFKATYVLSQEDIDASAGLTASIVNIATVEANMRNGKPYENDKEAKSVIDLPATEPNHITITKQAILRQVKRGERVPYIIKVENTSSSNAGPVNVIDTMPSGFRYIEDSAVLNGEKFTPEVSGRRVAFNNLQLGPNSKIEIRLDLMVLSSAGPGEHVNIASVTDRDGRPIAKDAKATVEIVAEPVFDCGDIVGTVFDDTNRNGYQDEGEKGLPGVRVATVNGWLITTDQYGRFHVPCAALPDQRIGSNFIMKLDTRTLPTGYRLTTENPRVIRLTAGKMSKLNFGAALGRVVRLDLQSAAFEGNSLQLKKQWSDNLNQLISVLKPEISVLRLSYTGSKTEGDLAKQRIKHVRKLIADLWKKNGGNYKLEIETRVEVSK